MSERIDVLAVLKRHLLLAQEVASEEQVAEAREVLAAVDELVDTHKALLATVERLDLAEGVCCCGDDMVRHPDPMSCGHMPVDAGHYYHGMAVERSHAALARIAPNELHDKAAELRGRGE